MREAKEKMAEIEGKIDKAEMAEAQAKLTEIASATAFDMSGSGASLDRLDDRLDDRIAEAQGKVRVASDAVAADEFNLTDGERKAMEAQALSEFAAQMGLEPAATEAAAPVDAPPELGPADEDAAEPEKVTEG
jgi:hypothetical protein